MNATLASKVASIVMLFCAGFTACTGNKPSSIRKKENVKDLFPNMQVFYSANLNGEIEPCGCRSNPTGGIHRRWNLIHRKLLKESNQEVLGLESGDLFYGSSPIPALLEKQWNYQAEVLAKAYNEFPIDAMAPGELDFVAGLQQFEKLRKMLNFPILSANVVFKKNKKLFLPPYVIVKKAEKKIGIFGLYDESLPLPDQLEALPHIQAAQALMQELRKKCDIVIALTHLGLEKDERLAQSVSGIDAVFGAHTQSYLYDPIEKNETHIFQTSFRGQHLGVYANGENNMYQIDERFDSPKGHLNPMDLLLQSAKREIGILNQSIEELLTPTPSIASSSEFQTFVRCIDCHKTQYDFHKKTPHFHAYNSLVKAKQNQNLECLKCHTVGALQSTGWRKLQQLTMNENGKGVNPESVAASMHQMPSEKLQKFSKIHIQVQCENCHGPAGDHPFQDFKKQRISTQVCFQCHTPERAPLWYDKQQKPRQDLIQQKLKSMTCPKDP